MRTAIAATSALVIGLTTLSVSSQANAETQDRRDTPGCVTKQEFKRIKVKGFHGPPKFGHRKNTVRKIFDTAGKRIKLPKSQQFWKNTHRYYRPCDRRRGVYVVNYVRPKKGAAYRAYNKDRGCLVRGSMYPITC